jgi:hypothetical protein
LDLSQAKKNWEKLPQFKVVWIVEEEKCRLNIFSKFVIRGPFSSSKDFKYSPKVSGIMVVGMFPHLYMKPFGIWLNTQLGIFMSSFWTPYKKIIFI